MELKKYKLGEILEFKNDGSIQQQLTKREIIERYIDDLRKIDISERASRVFESIPLKKDLSWLHV